MNICVDLDGTLIRSDTFHESLLELIKRNPLMLVMVVFWLLRGRAYCKQQVAARANLPVDSLPYHQPLIEWLKQQKQAGARLILVTAADQTIAERVAAHVGIFDEVMASDGQRNLKGTHKRDALNAAFGQHQYLYAGNAQADWAVWRDAKAAIVVNASRVVARKAAQLATVQAEFPRERLGLKRWLKVFRVHQYSKNALILVPWILGHQLTHWHALGLVLLGIVCFSLLASSVYISNDLLDLHSDRKHHSKCRRALAAGSLSIPTGVVLSVLCLLAAIALAWMLPHAFQFVLLGYYILTCLYSFLLKRLVLIDVYTLALLYTSRIFAGMAILDLGYSNWLVLFSFFWFTSLAFVKRFTELLPMAKSGQKGLHGRGYFADHFMSVKVFGICSGFVSVLIFGLYLSSEQADALYLHPQLLYAVCPLLLYWISRVWLLASEGKMHDDPIVFAIKDRVTYGLLLVVVVIMAVAAY